MRKRLSTREFDIMQILWNSSEPLLASDIQKKSADMTLNTVRGTMRKLLEKEYIHVADIDKSGTVFGRRYAPSLSPEQYMALEMRSVFPEPSKYRGAIFAAFLGDSENAESTLDELEEMIKKYRERLVD